MNPIDTFAAQLAQTILTATQAALRDAWAVGVVTDATSGVATVSWQGQTFTVKRNAAYTPVVGDVVLMGRPKDQLVIVCPIA